MNSDTTQASATIECAAAPSPDAETNRPAETTSGDQSNARTSSDQSNASTSGYQSTATASGNESTASASGNESTACTSGYRSNASTSGYQSTATASGNESTASTSGYRSAAVAVGAGCVARCGQDGAVLLAEYSDDGQFVGWRFGRAGHEIEAGKLYRAEGGKLVEVTE